MLNREHCVVCGADAVSSQMRGGVYWSLCHDHGLNAWPDEAVWNLARRTTERDAARAEAEALRILLQQRHDPDECGCGTDAQWCPLNGYYALTVATPAGTGQEG